VPLAWRILKATHAGQAFDGEGARRHGGRWNSPGVKMVYTSDSPALAALELLTQLNDATLLPRFVLISVDVPDDGVGELNVAELPARWRSHPAPPQLQALGDAWIQGASSVALRVPSAVEPRQHNYLLNPDHPDFGALKIGPTEPYAFDMRLLVKRGAHGPPQETAVRSAGKREAATPRSAPSSSPPTWATSTWERASADGQPCESHR
jgi:RES domain-containing protein